MERQHGFVISTPEEVADTGLPLCFDETEIPERLRLLRTMLGRKIDFVARRNGLIAPEVAATITRQIDAMTDAETALMTYSDEIFAAGAQQLLGDQNPPQG